MIAPKSRFKDCLQVTDQSRYDMLIDIPCKMDCIHCGFYRPVAEYRKARIRAGDWSMDKHGNLYLKIEGGTK